MKQNSISFNILLLAICSIYIYSCKKNDDKVIIQDPITGYIKLSSGYAIGAATRIEIYAADSPFTGYNKLYIALLDSVSNKYVEQAEIQLTPLMTMSTMSHSAPYENPSANTAINKLFPCSVSFIMPSSSGEWSLSVNVQNHENLKSGTGTFVFNVKDPTAARMFSFISLSDSGKYFVSFISPAKLIVGINDFEIVINKKLSMMMFPADSSLSISFVPTMPSMGHSSPNNVDPVYIGNGHYRGKANFTMTGGWRMSFIFKSGFATADSTHYFDISF